MFSRRSTRRQPAPRYHRLSVMQLENRLVPSGISWNGGANTLNWGDAANWSSNTVPTSTDDVTINIGVAGTINIGASAYGVRSLSDTTAPLSIASGGSLSLAVTETSTFGQNVTVSSGASLLVGAGATLVISPNVTLQDNGTVNLGGNNVDCANNGGAIRINVGNGGLLHATGSTFYNTGVNWNSELYVAGGGHLQASNCTISNLINVYLDNGNVLNAGDLVGNTINVPLYLPYSEVQDLSGTGSNNVSFVDIDILAGTVPNGQTLALNAIGTNTASLRYVFPGNFTIASGASMTVAPSVSLALNPGVTLQDNGTVTLATGDSVNCQNNGGLISISVGNGGLFSASGAGFYNTGVNWNSQLYVAGGGHLQASNCTISNLNNVYLDNGNVLNAGDLVGNTINVPLYLPYSEVQDLSGTGSNNVSFVD